MLPPGIFLWEPEEEALPGTASLEDSGQLSFNWKEGLAPFGEWGKSFESNGVGRFRKASIDCEDTVVIVGRCTSTMEVARFLYEQGVLDEWGAVIALTQTGGRGQLRRPWSSPSGNLYVSVVLPKAPVEGDWASAYGKLLPLLCGYMIAEIMGEMGAQLEVKWPNDLLQQDRKVGGMLIESKKEVDILGLGINLIESPPDALMREDRSVPAGIVQMGQGVPGPVGLWSALVNRWKKMYVILLGELKPPQFVTAMLPRLAWLGRRILVRKREGLSFQAEIIGISSDGGLVVRHPEGEEVIFSGSVTPL